MPTTTKNSTAKNATAKAVASKSVKNPSTHSTPKLEPDFSSHNEQAEQEVGQLSLDVYESSSELIILAPIAGVKLDDINLSITEDVLTISGKRKLESRIASDDYLIQECFWGEFSRAIVLPDHIDSTRISASFKDGILKVSIPKIAGSSKAKLIKIQSS